MRIGIENKVENTNEILVDGICKDAGKPTSCYRVQVVVDFKRKRVSNIRKKSKGGRKDSKQTASKRCKTVTTKKEDTQYNQNLDKRQDSQQESEESQEESEHSQEESEYSQQEGEDSLPAGPVGFNAEEKGGMNNYLQKLMEIQVITCVLSGDAY